MTLSTPSYVPGRWLWTAEQFQRARDLGAFGDDVRLELIEGEIIRKLPQSAAHAWAICAMQEALRSLFASRHHLR